MKHNFVFLGVFVLVSFAWPQTTRSLTSNEKAFAEKKLISITRARATALAAGDCQGWAKYVDADVRFIEGEVSGNRDSVLKGCEADHNAPTGYKQERILSDFHVLWIGDTPVVNCHYETVEHFGDVTLTETVRQISTMQRRSDSWIVRLVVNVPVNYDPPATKTDATTLDALTGQYAWPGAPGMVDTVTRKSDKIYVQTTRETSATELVPIGPDTFFIHGSAGDRLTFIRDANGKVIGEEARSPDGQGYRADRIN